MINLLPPQEKKEIFAGRANVLLLNYIIASIVLLALLSVLIGAIYYLLATSSQDAREKIEENNIKASQYAQVEKDATEFKNNLSTAQQILGEGYRYSKVITSIARAVPPGMAIESLNLSTESIATPLVLNVGGNTHADAIKLKTSFENSGIFSNVFLESVSKNETGDRENAKPISIMINATLDPEAIK